MVRVGGAGDREESHISGQHRLACCLPACLPGPLSCLKPQASRGVSGFTLQFITNTDKFPPFNCLRKNSPEC
jgi:hypothetical protein